MGIKVNPDYIVPSTIAERNRLRTLIASQIDEIGLVPPVTRKQLTDLALQLIKETKLQSGLTGWLMVEINNCLWSDTFASIPYQRRVLLLPKCLRNTDSCTAEIDELGLLCHRCGACSIASLEEKAEKLGVISLVAEGITAVNQLIEMFENNDVDAVIGVGCLESLEKTFAPMLDNAVPGMAVALNCAGCKNTNVDTDYVEKIINTFVETKRTTSVHENRHAVLENRHAVLETQHATSLQDDRRLKDKINQWFTPDHLIRLSGDKPDLTSDIARNWLCGDGKRWRPYLLVSAYQAITGSDDLPEQVKLAAISVEAFHKASLIHDDIQDNDRFRYGKPTIYSTYGVPVALNVGDKLLGDGYRLLSECGQMELVKEVSAAHIALCHGQGLELEWRRKPRMLTMDEVLHIIENKTVPAFYVALSFAIICAGGDETLKTILRQYAFALGMAYQLLDDLDDFQSESVDKLHPTSVLAAICEDCNDKVVIEKLLVHHAIPAWINENKPLLDSAITKVSELAESYRQQTFDSLIPLKNTELKRLLFRVTKRVLK